MLVINKSIGNAWDMLATKESSVEYAKKAIECFEKNYELCKENQNDSGMAEALTEKATTLELPVLQTPKSDILAEYKRAAVLATRSRNYSLLVTIYGNISSLFAKWPGKESQAEGYDEKEEDAKEKAEEAGEKEEESEEEGEREEEEEGEEERDEDDEDLRDVQEYLNGKKNVQIDAVEMKTVHSLYSTFPLPL